MDHGRKSELSIINLQIAYSFIPHHAGFHLLGWKKIAKYVLADEEFVKLVVDVVKAQRVVSNEPRPPIRDSFGPQRRSI